MKELILSYQAGNKDVYGDILKTYKNLMYGIIAKYNKNVLYSKEDCFQIANISLMKALKTFDTSKSYKFSTYLQTIVTNDLNTVFRPVQKRNAIVNSLDDVLPNEDKLTVKDTIADDTNIEEEVMENSMNNFISNCLKKYKNDFPRKFQSVQYSIKDIPNRQIEKYVPYKRSQISKNWKHFCEYCKQEAIKENIINN